MHDATIIVPIAHDFDYINRRIVCGKGTLLACNQAIEVAGESANSYFYSGACRWPKHPDTEVAYAMLGHIVNRAPDYKDRVLLGPLRECTAIAPSFNTLGEVIAIRALCIHLFERYGKESIRRIVFTVKEWHGNRVEDYAMTVLFEFNFPIDVYRHSAAGTLIDKKLEPLKTWRGIREYKKLMAAGSIPLLPA